MQQTFGAGRDQLRQTPLRRREEEQIAADEHEQGHVKGVNEAKDSVFKKIKLISRSALNAVSPHHEKNSDTAQEIDFVSSVAYAFSIPHGHPLLSFKNTWFL